MNDQFDAMAEYLPIEESKEQCIWKGVATRLFSRPENYFKARKTTMAMCQLACDGKDEDCKFFYTPADIQRAQEDIRG